MTREAGNLEMITISGTDLGNGIFTATGLIPRTSYTFSVSAMNSDNQNGVSIITTGSTATPEGNNLLSTSHSLYSTLIIFSSP